MRTAEEIIKEAKRINEAHFKEFISAPNNRGGFLEFCYRAVIYEEDMKLIKLKYPELSNRDLSLSKKKIK